MIRSELVQSLADANLHLHARNCEAVVDAILGRIADAIAAGDRVEQRGFGAFTIVEQRARMERNPKSGVPVSVQAKRRLQVKVGKDMRDRLNLEATTL